MWSSPLNESQRAPRPGGRPAAAWPPLAAVAHGSSDPRAAAAVNDLVSTVADRARLAGLPDLRVRAAYLGHALPSVPAVLESMAGSGERAVAVLPLLLSPAYHSDTDLPEVLREAQGRLPGLRIGYGKPLGPHRLLLRGLERRLAEAGVATGAGRVSSTGVVLAAAGSSRPEASAAVARMAGQWRSARGWSAVLPAYASAASPAPGDAVTALLRAGVQRVVVATYLLAPGLFADQVREQSLAAGAHAVSAPLGAAPEVADVIIERYLRVARLLGPGRAEAGRRASR